MENLLATAIPVNIIISIIAKANSFLTAGFRGELWAASFIGIDLSYKTGWLKFNKIGTASADWESFGINVSGDYLPLLSVKEDPVTSGSKGKASGYLLSFGLYYILTDGFIADLNYSYNPTRQTLPAQAQGEAELQAPHQQTHIMG